MAQCPLDDHFEFCPHALLDSPVNRGVFSHPLGCASLKGCFGNSVATPPMGGLPDFRIHDLRHSMASNMVNSGRSIYEVAKVLGHSQLKTSRRYAHLSDEPYWPPSMRQRQPPEWDRIDDRRTPPDRSGRVGIWCIIFLQQLYLTIIFGAQNVLRPGAVHNRYESLVVLCVIANLTETRNKEGTATCQVKSIN